MRYGGRAKGTPNKPSQTLIDKAKELDCDPFEILILFAKGDWKALGYDSRTVTKYTKNGQSYEVDTVTAEQRLNGAAQACQYLHPKRKALEGNIEVIGDFERPLKDLSDDELDELVNRK